MTCPHPSPYLDDFDPVVRPKEYFYRCPACQEITSPIWTNRDEARAWIAAPKDTEPATSEPGT